MKINAIKNRWFLPVLSCAALTMTSHSKAAVIVKFEQVGTDVVATWTGSIDLGVVNRILTLSGKSAFIRQLYATAGSNKEFKGGVAATTSLDGTIAGFGASAGFNNGNFWIGNTISSDPTNTSLYNFGSGGVNVFQTFGNQTLAGIGASAFNDTLAWTSSEGGTNTISYTTVPEPSSTALLGLGALALAVRRRR